MFPILGSVMFLVIIVTLVVLMLKFKDKLNSKWVNGILIGLIVICYITLLLIYFYDESDVEKWHFKNALTFSNMSPLLFTFSPIIFVLNEKCSRAVKSLYALLAIAMGLVSIIGPTSCFLQNHINKFTPMMIFDGFSHLLCAVLGIYFVVSGQVKVERKTLYNGLVLTSGIVVFVLFCNFTFKTNFFGMGYFGEYNIYNVLKFESYFLTLFVYLICLYSIIFVTYLMLKLLLKIKARNK